MEWCNLTTVTGETTPVSRTASKADVCPAPSPSFSPQSIQHQQTGRNSCSLPLVVSAPPPQSPVVWPRVNTYDAPNTARLRAGALHEDVSPCKLFHIYALLLAVVLILYLTSVPVGGNWRLPPPIGYRLIACEDDVTPTCWKSRRLVSRTGNVLGTVSVRATADGKKHLGQVTSAIQAVVCFLVGRLELTLAQSACEVDESGKPAGDEALHSTCLRGIMISRETLLCRTRAPRSNEILSIRFEVYKWTRTPNEVANWMRWGMGYQELCTMLTVWYSGGDDQSRRFYITGMLLPQRGAATCVEQEVCVVAAYGRPWQSVVLGGL
ncbi:hypothetical protein PR048_009651 [Dryococelus australis]|uniref:Transmembrane protein n=1 Tax=Dryococelus australis TaxID=614101 RepID=A0ABQ9I0J7_9NEOP|nr:hypothetical protein PR048_009651 [Dryococelus australis]